MKRTGDSRNATPWTGKDLGLAAVAIGAAIVASLGSVMVLNHFAKMPHAPIFPEYLQDSFGIGLTMLCAGSYVLVVALTRAIRSFGGLPPWCPWLVFLALGFGAVGLHQSMRAADETMLNAIGMESVNAAALSLKSYLEARQGGLQHMAMRWSAGSYDDEQTWQLDAIQTMASFDDEFLLAAVDPAKNIRWIESMLPSRPEAELLLSTMDASSPLPKARGEQTARLIGSDMMLSVPIPGSAGQSHMIAGAHLTQLMRLASRSVPDDVKIQLMPVGGDARFDERTMTTDFDFMGNRLRVGATLTPAFVESHRSKLPELTLLIGLVISALAALLTRSVRMSQEGRRRAEHAHALIARESALRLTAERATERLYNSAPCGYHSVDANRTILRMNDTELEWLGYTREEVVGKMRYDDLLTPASREKAVTLFAKFLAQGESREVEIDLVRKDGSILPLSISAKAVYDARGNFVHSLSTAFDLSLRKQQESALIESQERLESTLASANIGLFSWNTETNSFTLSDTAKGQLGYAAGELADSFEAWRELFHPEDVENATALLKSQTANAWPNFELEARFRHRNGSYRTLILRASPSKMVSSRGKLFGILIDISHRKTAEERYRTLLEAAPEAMVIVDSQGRIVLLNSQMESLLGYSRQELVGRSVESLVPLAQRQSHAALRFAYSAKPALRPMGRGRELTALHKDGREIPVEIALSPSGDKDSPLIIAAVRDISMRREAEHRIKEAKNAAEAANQAKSTFLAHMSHEMRTPLGIILGYTDMLEEGLGRDEQESSLRYIRKSAENLLVLINDVLDLAKVEAGSMEVEHLRFAFLPFIQDTMSALTVKADEKGLALTWTLAEDLPRTISSDPARLRQILLNVVGNSLKFTERGSVAVSIRALKAAPGAEGTLEFLISDTGCGIAEESRKNLFQPFKQAHVGSTRAYGGTGLGLSLSRELARKLGGDLRLVRSQIGQGSTFAFTVASGVPDAADTLAPPVPSVDSPRSAASIASPLEGVNVLLVEDFEDNQILIRSLIAAKGARVEVAGNGREGAERALAKNFDVVLMDIQMPVLNGYEAVHELRSAGYHRPVVALTAHAMKGESERCIAAGFDDYLTKPIRTDALVSVIRKYARPERPSDAAPLA